MTPVSVRGTIYRSIADAAIGEGVNRKTVHNHLEAGTPHLIGLQPQTNRRKCDIDGVTYPSMISAAIATGRNIKTIERKVKRQRDKA